ncbi:MAG: YlxR family protein [Clostridia bacterium]|nr:YlxR family protein [Clostridia bacterium]
MPNNAKNLRKCAVCRIHADKSEMIRFVKTKDEKIFLDRSKTADGRGVWVHDSAECIQKLIKKKLLNTAFKCSVSESLYEELDGKREF